MITAETGRDMSRFPTAGHLASWAGVCPGHHESAGRIKSSKTRPGNPYLKGALGTAATAAGRTKDTYLGARYRRLSTRTGKSKAIVAIERTILVVIWNMAQPAPVRRPRSRLLHPATTRPHQETRRLQLEAMGCTVTLDRAG